MLTSALTGQTDRDRLLDDARLAWMMANDSGAHGWFERMCPHGIGHPDPDSMRWSREFHEDLEPRGSVHGCDGCCSPPEADQ